MLRPPVLLACIALALSGLAGCGSDLVLPGDGTPAQLSISGNNQSGAPGSTLPDSLEVQVLDNAGLAVPGQTVTFALDSEAPGAEVTPDIATTRSDGRARARWKLGAPSGTQRVVARVTRSGLEPLEARFTANVGTSTASSIAAADGNEQSGPAGSVLANPLMVLVTDEFGNPVGGVEVQWEAQSGSIDPASSVSGTDGRAGANWTLGTASGSQTATASSGDLSGSPVTFTATALPGSPTTVELVSGNNQSAAPGNELANPLVVRLVDNSGNGVPNRAVTWVVATGGGSVSSATSTTDQDGRASTRWTLGDAAGQNTLNAVVSGVGVVGFTATATSGGGGGGGGGGGASRLEFRVQPSDTEEGRSMSPPVEVAVLDQAGNLVTDREFPIKLELLDDRGRVRADGTVDTRSGVATFTIRIDRRGKYRLRASTDGLPSVDSDRFEVEED